MSQFVLLLGGTFKTTRDEALTGHPSAPLDGHVSAARAYTLACDEIEHIARFPSHDLVSK